MIYEKNTWELGFGVRESGIKCRGSGRGVKHQAPWAAAWGQGWGTAGQGAGAKPRGPGAQAVEAENSSELPDLFVTLAPK